jgi:hypothetical protein
MMAAMHKHSYEGEQQVGWSMSQHVSTLVRMTAGVQPQTSATTRASSMSGGSVSQHIGTSRLGTKGGGQVCAPVGALA